MGCDGFPKSAKNPFKTVDTSKCREVLLFYSVTNCYYTGISEDEVEAQLGKEEAAVQKSGCGVALHSISTTMFLVLGLELEESQ